MPETAARLASAVARACGGGSGGRAPRTRVGRAQMSRSEAAPRSSRVRLERFIRHPSRSRRGAGASGAIPRQLRTAASDCQTQVSNRRHSAHAPPTRWDLGVLPTKRNSGLRGGHGFRRSASQSRLTCLPYETSVRLAAGCCNCISVRCANAQPGPRRSEQLSFYTSQETQYAMCCGNNQTETPTSNGETERAAEEPGVCTRLFHPRPPTDLQDVSS